MEEFKPKLIIIAGPNGSGKTSLTTQILKHEWIEDCVYINPDNIAQEKFGDWNNIEAVIQAAKFCEELRNDCLENRKSLIFETVLSAIDKIDFIENAIQLGYFVRLFFVGTNHPSINASRIAHRVLEGGHDVPITKIISRYSKSIANCILLTEFVDRLYVYDNSVDYEKPKLLFRTKNGKLEKFYSQINDWAKPILDNCEKL
jgi:predicted ABC-type ATPase